MQAFSSLPGHQISQVPVFGFGISNCTFLQSNLWPKSQIVTYGRRITVFLYFSKVLYTTGEYAYNLHVTLLLLLLLLSRTHSWPSPMKEEVRAIIASHGKKRRKNGRKISANQNNNNKRRDWAANQHVDGLANDIQFTSDGLQLHAYGALP